MKHVPAWCVRARWQSAASSRPCRSAHAATSASRADSALPQRALTDPASVTNYDRHIVYYIKLTLLYLINVLELLS